jgi:hypothetical protein
MSNTDQETTDTENQTSATQGNSGTAATQGTSGTTNAQGQQNMAAETDAEGNQTNTDNMVNRDQAGVSNQNLNNTQSGSNTQSGITTTGTTDNTGTLSEESNINAGGTAGTARALNSTGTVNSTTTESGTDTSDATTQSGTSQSGTTAAGTATDNMADTDDQQGVTYDNMNNTDAAEDREYSSVYDAYLDPAVELSEQERQMIEEARRDYEARKVSMTVVEARPDVNISELIEEIKEETRLPKELEDAKMEGTVLVKFEVDAQGAISNAEVIDGFISQTKEDGSLMSYIRLSDKTQSEIAEEINKENLMEFKGEDRDKIIEAVTKESVRVVESTSGKWQSSQDANATEKSVMVMPIRFDIED